MAVDLSVSLGPLTFNTPLMNASGTFHWDHYSDLMDFSNTLGALVSKTVTPKPINGNAQSRTAELLGIGMLNSIGLQNPGIEAFMNEDMPNMASYGVPCILSIAGHTLQEYADVAQTVFHSPHGRHVVALELNLSCPNVDEGGLLIGTSCPQIEAVVRAVKAVSPVPVFTKLTPNVTDIVVMADAAITGGTDGLTLINTVVGMGIDIRTQKPLLSRIKGGYSGPGIKPIALRHVWDIHAAFPHIPIIGVGGISTWEDAIEFMLAGASAVQVGTINFRHPTAMQDILLGIRQYLQQRGETRLRALVGASHGMNANVR